MRRFRACSLRVVRDEKQVKTLKQLYYFSPAIMILFLISDPIAKEQCRLNLVSSSPTPLTGNMSVGIGE